jgi:glycosyltransferase involved in cell wall biosynthesis
MIAEISGMAGVGLAGSIRYCARLVGAGGMALAPAQSMRVLFVLPRIVAGGLERVTLNLIEGLQQHGVDCRLAVGDPGGELLGEARALAAVDVVAAGGRLRFLDGLWRAIRRYRPTHIVSVFADVSLLALAARRLAGSRAALLVGVHGTHRESAAGPGRRARWKYRRDAALMGWVYRRSDAVVAVSQGVAQDIRERYRLDPSRLHAIYSPILTGRVVQRLAAQAPAAVPPRKLVAVGRLAHEKGFDVLLRAMPAVVARFPGVRLVVHGEGPERARLEALVESLGLADRVTLPGSTGDPLAAIAAADLLVFPSRHEGFGVALVEALACGRPVVASDCAHGPAEILEGGRHGQLVPPEDPEALAKALMRAFAGEAIFDSSRLRARAADFSAEAAVTRYLALLAAVGRS